MTIAALSLAMGFAACKKEDRKPVEQKPVEQKPVEQKPVEQKPAGEAPTADVPKLADAAGAYTIDDAHSTVIFRAKHMNASYTYGGFYKVSGTVRIDADASKSEVSVEVDTASLFSGNKERDDHLKGPDFFNTKQFPKITFKSTAIKEAAPGKYEVTGDLTLHGVTKPFTTTFEHVGFGPHPMMPGASVTGFHSAVTLKRSDFEMKNMIGQGISDEIDLMIAIEAIRK